LGLMAPVGNSLFSPLERVMLTFRCHHAGKFVDWNYRRTVDRLAKTQGVEYDKKSPDFPLERTRLRGVYLLSGTTVLGIIGYGLTLRYRWVSLPSSTSSHNPLLTATSTLR
jgi:hypothetical protein